MSEGGVSVILRSDDYESVHYGPALAAAALLLGGRVRVTLRRLEERSGSLLRAGRP